MMEADRIDIDLLIDEIEKRPAIWNFECPDYKNRVLKSHWEEFVEMFGESGDTTEKKKVFGAMLQKKWKSLRHNFARELKRQKTLKSGSTAKCHTPYIYFIRLRLLENSVSNKETTSNFDEDTAETDTQDSADSDLQSDSTRETSQTQNIKKEIKLNLVDQHFSDILTKSIQARENRETEQNNQDEDKLFCLSLYNELQKVPEQGRIKTKIELFASNPKSTGLL